MALTGGEANFRLIQNFFFPVWPPELHTNGAVATNVDLHIIYIFRISNGVEWHMTLKTSRNLSPVKGHTRSQILHCKVKMIMLQGVDLT